jgi:hypothetical protein
MTDQPPQQEDRIQALANILSLVAIVGGMDKAAVQRVLVALGGSLVSTPGPLRVSPELASQLLAQIARDEGEQAVFRIASDMSFVARAWKPVLSQYAIDQPQSLLPFAEILFALFNYSGMTLYDHGAFERFGGPDVVLALPQLTAALKPYPAPRPGLLWEIVGFQEPPDQAVIASDAATMYLFKAAVTPADLRFSELARDSGEAARREVDVHVDAPLFAAFLAGLLGDMLYWSARLRADAAPGQRTWQWLKQLLTAPEEAKSK